MGTGESITLDGRLDEDIWMRAVPATNLIQMEPDNGEPATEQTEVRIVYSADNLYIGATMFDSAPDKLIFYQMARDGNLPPTTIPVGDRHLPRRPNRVLVRDEPVGLDG